jgi:hypothetical protein
VDSWNWRLIASSALVLRIDFLGLKVSTHSLGKSTDPSGG